MVQTVYICACAEKGAGGGVYKYALQESGALEKKAYLPCDKPMFAAADVRGAIFRQSARKGGARRGSARRRRKMQRIFFLQRRFFGRFRSKKHHGRMRLSYRRDGRRYVYRQLFKRQRRKKLPCLRSARGRGRKSAAAGYAAHAFRGVFAR